MNEKQLWVHLLAYNVIRLLMAQAACHAGVDPRELSFKHTVQLWTEWLARGLSATNDGGRLFTLIAQMQGGQSARTPRATNAKATTQTLSLAEGAARPSSPTRPEAWSCV
jgi:hypothetical protein